MPSTPSEASLADRVRIMRLIVFAMANGVFVFMLLAFFLQQAGPRPNPFGAPILTYLALVCTPAALVLHVLLPGKCVPARRPLGQERAQEPASANDRDAVGPWCDLFQTRLIFALAILEGAAFLALIAYFFEGHLPDLVAAALLLAVLASKFPTVSSLERWIEEQRNA